MANLPNAPLIEVILELRWQISEQNDFEKYRFLEGDLYNQIKGDYPYREPLVPINAPFPIQMLKNKPTLRFRTEETGWPLIQMGPGLITTNTIDANYEWDDFHSRINKVIDALYEVDFFGLQQELSFTLKYFDFFEIDFKRKNALHFIENNLHIGLNQSILTTTKSPENIAINMSFQVEQGLYYLQLYKAIHKEIEGLIVETSIERSLGAGNREEISNWLINAHDFTSDRFKQMTKGQLYKSFQ